jgi:hypothetical protein
MPYPQLTGEPWFTYTVFITIYNNMTREHFTKRAQEEIENLNEVIDMKIIKGISYRNEARRHKFLLSKIGNSTRVQTLLFGKSAGFMANLFS